jgi:hypothetical protein
MEASTSATSKNSETEVLLTVIIDELKRIGSTLVRQDERIEALTRGKNHSQLPDWDAGSVVVKPPYSSANSCLLTFCARTPNQSI